MAAEDVKVADAPNAAPNAAPNIRGFDETYTLVCIDGKVKVSSTSLKEFKFFRDALNVIDPNATKCIDVAERFTDIVTLFAYIYRRECKKEEIPTVLSFLDKWSAYVSIGASLFQTVDDLKYIPRNETDYVNAVLKEYIKKNSILAIHKNMYDLPDHVIGKIAKVLIKGLAYYNSHVNVQAA